MNELPYILRLHLTDDEECLPVQRAVFSDFATGEVFTELSLCDGISFSYEVKQSKDETA
jgi:hypothetical protein